MPALSYHPAAPPLVTEQEVEGEVLRLFDSGGTGLVVRVLDDEGTRESRSDAFRVLLQSLEMYDERYRERAQEILVAPPDASVVSKALRVLGDPSHQRKLFEQILVLL